MVQDLTSDMLTHIRNASAMKQNVTFAIYNKLNIKLLQVLKNEGWISNFRLFINKKNKVSIKIFLRYKGWWVKKPLFSKLIRISRPGQRIFSSYDDFSKKINALKYSRGIAIISTSSGVMSHTKAVALKKGGEVICYIG